MFKVLQEGPQKRSSRVVTVERHGRWLRVQPPCAGVLGALETVCRVAEDDGGHGYRVREQLEPLLHRGAVDSDAGLELIVWRLLQKAGYRVQRRWMAGKPRRLPAPDVSRVHPLGPCDDQLFSFVRANHEGIIRYSRPRINLAWLIAQLALALPEATIAVATASKDAAERLVRQLRKWLPDAGMATAKYCPQGFRRVIAATFFGLADPWVEVEKRDVVVVPDAREAISQRGRTALCPMDARFRLFGLLPAGCKLSPRERDRIVAIFGLKQIEIPRHGYHLRPIQTVMLPIEGGPHIPFDTGVLALKRQGIWTHPIRNRRIARLAEAIRKPDTCWLDQHAPAVGRAIQGEQCPHVTVLVEGVEHALALAERLPGWPIATGPEVIADGLDRQQRRQLIERHVEWSDSGHCIATTTGLATVNVAALDVIIWAGGGQHLPPLPKEMLACKAAMQQQPLLLVDFRDRHHPRLRRWSRQRMAAYAVAGWFPPGVDPLLARVDAFLAQRPRRSGP